MKAKNMSKIFFDANIVLDILHPYCTRQRYAQLRCVYRNLFFGECTMDSLFITLEQKQV